MTDVDARALDGSRDPGAPSSFTWRQAALLSLKLVVGIVVVLAIYRKVLPFIAGAPWAAVVDVVSELTKRQVLLLAAIWFAGLWAHTFVLTAAMPRLTHRRALTLNLTGSAVSNLVPMGGALGIGLNYWMTRHWGFSRPAFTLYTFVTNLWDVMAKLSLPALALGALLLTGDVTHPQLANVAEVTMLLLGALLLVVLATLSSERAAAFLGRLLTRPIQLIFRVFRSKRTIELSDSFVELRRESVGLLRGGGWIQLSLGMLAYSALQALLLWASLHMLGTTLTGPEIFAGYALERVLTLIMITPAGTGFVEVGMTGLLIAFGGDPITTVAGVLIYRAFTFGLEIPVGAANLAVWFWRRRSARPPDVADPAGPEVALEVAA